jgi:hypothetical protein
MHAKKDWTNVKKSNGVARNLGQLTKNAFKHTRRKSMLPSTKQSIQNSLANCIPPPFSLLPNPTLYPCDAVKGICAQSSFILYYGIFNCTDDSSQLQLDVHKGCNAASLHGYTTVSFAEGCREPNL